MEMTFSVNDSPYAAREGKFVTSRQLRDRLFREMLKDVSLKVSDTETSDSFNVAGRGEMSLSILIETMRREGYEFQVSPPRVLYQEIDGKTYEPVERLVVDVPGDSVGAVIEKLGQRKADMLEMTPVGARMRIEFLIPARGLFGYRNDFLTDTKGEGIMASQAKDLPNLDALCSDYGLSVVPGLVTDTQRYYQNTPFLFFPTLDTSVDAASALSSDATIMLYGSRGMTVTKPVRDTITVKPFLSTSDKGIAVKADNSQTPGSYVVGAVATESVDDNITARLTVLGCDSLCGDTVTSSFANVDNSALFLASITAGFKDVSPISVEPVSLAEENNTVTTGGLWGLLFIFVIPAALLIFGFVRWTRRRKL